jgi:hypothetical protein
VQFSRTLFVPKENTPWIFWLCGLLGAKPATFPMQQNHKLSMATGELMADPDKSKIILFHFVSLRLQPTPIYIHLFTI